MIRILALVAVATLVSASSVGSQTLTQRETDPVAVFNRARATWNAMTYPKAVVYQVAVTTIAGSKKRTEHFAGQVSSSDAHCRVSAFSDEEQRAPSTPHGTNFTFSVGVGFSSGSQPIGGSSGADMTIAQGVIGAHASSRDSFGIPEISPLYSFGIRGSQQRQIESSLDPDSPKIIGRVATSSAKYQITSLGSEPLEGGPAEHLLLKPLVDGKRDRVRDLWIDETSNTVVRARVLGNFTRAPDVNVPWLIDFALVNDATFIKSETAEAPLRGSYGRFDRVIITFDHIAPRDRSNEFKLVFPLFSVPPDLYREPPETNADDLAC